STTARLRYLYSIKVGGQEQDACVLWYIETTTLLLLTTVTAVFILLDQSSQYFFYHRYLLYLLDCLLSTNRRRPQSGYLSHCRERLLFRFFPFLFFSSFSDLYPFRFACCTRFKRVLFS